MNFNSVKTNIDSIFDNNSTLSNKLQLVCNLLKETIEHYDWVGFYFKDDNEKVLNLAQYAGEPTDHTTIPFGKGICGQVALSNEIFVVQDIKQQDNYIACSIDVIPNTH